MSKLPDMTDDQLKANFSRIAALNFKGVTDDDVYLIFQMAEQYFMDRFNNRPVPHEQHAKNLEAKHGARCADYERLLAERDAYIAELQQAHQRLYAEHNTLLESHNSLLARLK